MTNASIALNIITACKGYQPLTDFITTTFPDNPLTYSRGLNIDEDEQSRNFDAYLPMIVIDPIQKSDNKYDIDKRYELVLQTFLENDVKPVLVDQVLTYEGIDQIEELNGLIVDAIKANDVGVDLEEIEPNQEPYRGNAVYEGFIVLTFAQTKCIGAS